MVGVRCLPRPVLGCLAGLAGRLAFLADAKGRRTAVDNLRCAFPEKPRPELFELACKSYQHMAWTFLDLFWAPNLTRGNWRRHVELVLEDPEGVERARRTGALWITPHFGNFEWLALIWGLNGVQFQIVAQQFRNRALTPLFQRLREHTGHRIIPQEGAMLRLFRELRRGGHSALLADLAVPLGQSPAVIDCLGLQTCVTTLHAELAVRCGVPIIPALALRRAGGRYELKTFAPMWFAAEMPRWQIAQRCWDVFEPSVRAHPEQWMWMYKHWRYRPADASPADYPSYAHGKRKFDRILAAQQEAG